MTKKTLTLDETKNCLRAWHELHDEYAYVLLFTSNKGLIYTIAKKYYNSGVDFDDLLSAGNEGLMRAINKFDYINKPIEGFSSYIAIAIENQIRMELRKYNKHSHVLSLDQPLGQNKDGDELKVEDLIGTDADDIINEVIKGMKIDIVREALKCLTTRERQIILLRYGLDEHNQKSQEELAQMFNCSRTLISRQEQKALTKMRHPRNTKKIKDFIDD